MLNWFGFLGLRERTRSFANSSIRSYQQPHHHSRSFHIFHKPPASEVLTCHLESKQYPPWTSYFVKYRSIRDDQRGKSHFNWTLKNGQNYHVLRTGCWPYIKYHCTQRPVEDLSVDDVFFRVIKLVNLGIPCLAYGLSFTLYPRKVTETVVTSHGPVTIYFHYQEKKGAMY